MDNIVKALGLRIRQLRYQANMSQEELAFIAGLNAAHLGQIERGLKKPTIETINQIAEALNTPLNVLFTFESDNAKPSKDDNNSAMNKIVAQLTSMTDEEQHDILKLIRIFKHFRSNQSE